MAKTACFNIQWLWNSGLRLIRKQSTIACLCFMWIYGVYAYEKIKFLRFVRFESHRSHSCQPLEFTIWSRSLSTHIGCRHKSRFFNFSPNSKIISSAAYELSAYRPTFYICQRSTLPSSYLHQQDERGCLGNFKVRDYPPQVINLAYHTTTI